MKKFLLLISFLFCSAVYAQSPESAIFRLPRGVGKADYLPGRVIVKFKSETSLFQVRAVASALRPDNTQFQVSSVNQLFRNSLQATVAPGRASAINDTIGIDRIYELNYSGSSGIESVINGLLKNPDVEYAEPRYIHYQRYIPNDQFYATAQNYLRQVKADKAWDVIRSAAGVAIAIVDSGSDMDHLDLKGNLLLPGKDLVGASFATLKEDDDPDVKSDSTDHGVRVSGLASAVSDNGLGISSIAFDAKLMIVKVAADDNATAIYRGYEGIKYAVDQGAKIINCSWGSTAGGAYGQDIIRYATSRGALVIAAAGNENSLEAEYPAAYEGVMAVTSVDADDRKSSFSNFGSHISITAPGEALTTANRDNYVVARGTSFSVPIVSGAAALVKSRFPSFDMLQVREQLRVTSDNIDALNPGHAGLLGAGRLNVFRAVTEQPPSVRQQRIVLADKGRGSIPPGDTLRISVELKNILSAASGLNVRLTSPNANVEVIDEQIAVGSLASLETKLAGPFRVYIRPTAPDNEQVVFSLRYSADGGYSDSEQFVVRIALDYMNINAGRISTTITSNGRIGFSSTGARNGQGFTYKGEQLLYEASLMIGTGSTRVSNNARNDSGGADEHFYKKARVAKVDGAAVAFRALSEFDDSGSPVPLGLRIIHSQTVPDSDSRFVIADYELHNTSGSFLSNLYAGLFMDWDVDASGRDVTRFDPVNRIAYVHSRSGNGVYAGLKLLNREVPAVYYPMSDQVPGDPLQNGGGLSIAEKYAVLSGGVNALSLGESSPTGYDIAFVSGYGPYSIPANGSVKLSFALVAADNLADLQQVAEAAQARFDALEPSDPISPEEGFVLEQNVPNPAVSTTLLRFSIPAEGYTELQLFNMSGQRVRELVKADLPRGSYSINLDVSSLNPGIYFCHMRYQGRSKTVKLLVTR